MISSSITSSHKCLMTMINHFFTRFTFTSLLILFLGDFCQEGYSQKDQAHLFKKKQSQTILKNDHPWLKKQQLNYKKSSRLDPLKFDQLWLNLPNFSYSYSLAKNNTTFEACRRALMDLCSYQEWGFPRDELQQVRSAWAGLAILITLENLGDDLPFTERQRAEDRLLSQLQLYKNLLRGNLTPPPWWGMTNHPDSIVHGCFAFACSQHKTIRKNAFAKECGDHFHRILRKNFNLNDANPMSRSSTRWPKNIPGDWIRLWLLQNHSFHFQNLDHQAWAKGRLMQYQSMLLPGGSDLCLTNSSLPIMHKGWSVPVCIGLGELSGDNSGFFMASQLQRSFSQNWNPWLFSAINWLKTPVLTTASLRKLRFQDPESGTYCFRSSLNRDGSHLTFHCGYPLIKSTYQSWASGRQDISLAESLSNQGSWTWQSDQRWILGTQLSNSPTTKNFNTLLIGGQGQHFDAYPHGRPGQWRHEAQASKVFINEHFGSSWLLGGEFRGAYPEKLGLKAYIRILLILSPKMVMDVQLIETNDVQKMTQSYHSPDYPLDPRPDGFYQKVTGVQRKGLAWPKGDWSINYSKDHLKKDVATASHIANTQLWTSCSVMASADLLKDLHIQRSSDHQIKLSYYRNQYRARFLITEKECHVQVNVFGKPFYNTIAKRPQ